MCSTNDREDAAENVQFVESFVASGPAGSEEHAELSFPIEPIADLGLDAQEVAEILDGINEAPLSALTTAEETPKPKLTPEEQSLLLQAAIAKISAENERLRAARNSRRWRAERDPVEYEEQKVRQRAEYAKVIAETEGREVRPYMHIQGDTPAEREANRKARKRAADAQRKAAKRAAETPEQATERKRKNTERMRAKRAAEKAKVSD
ncbi:hypothetical protein PVW46_11035 [Mameliella sp. AT18]|uniref:hypothetical protein n=1 Tax=Mameliella sp. AT18 TaxID=3028385 RepID=UPI00237A1D6C|nr:hypothetical protein [Mameliella sp. AT18]MDD9730443.1 hypothetical protein [Mameliella sp. AT18]